MVNSGELSCKTAHELLPAAQANVRTVTDRSTKRAYISLGLAEHRSTCGGTDERLRVCKSCEGSFRKRQDCQDKDEVPATARVLITYGGGSIKKNGVYEQVISNLPGRTVFEFGGIEANPLYETLMKAAEIVRREKIDLLLAVGGGSVLDGTKFIAAAALYEGGDPWKCSPNKSPYRRSYPWARY